MERAVHQFQYQRLLVELENRAIDLRYKDDQRMAKIGSNKNDKALTPQHTGDHHEYHISYILNALTHFNQLR